MDNFIFNRITTHFPAIMTNSRFKLFIILDREKKRERMQWYKYNAAGGPTSFGHQSSRDRSDVLDVVTTKDDHDENYDDYCRIEIQTFIESIQ